MKTYNAIKSQDELIKLLKENDNFQHYAFQDLNFNDVEAYVEKKYFADCIFLGCELSEYLLKDFENCLIFPAIHVPYNVFISTLYSGKMLFDKYELGKPETYENTFDQIVYRRFIKKGIISDDIVETLARSLHDHSVSVALADFLKKYDEKKVVGIMGGHGISRSDKSFSDVAKISKKLTEKGYLMVSGGGPGAMEATHLGAWMAGKTDKELSRSIEILSRAPNYSDVYWLDKAMEVLRLYPTSDFESLGIPTWHYGHEPTTPFATHIAKYFANSIREDGILTIAKGGIVFTPGSAGTLQEIFQEAAQNHYLTFGYSSPMAFYDRAYWTEAYPIYTLLADLQEQGKYKNLILSINDTIDETVDEIVKFTDCRFS